MDNINMNHNESKSMNSVGREQDFPMIVFEISNDEERFVFLVWVLMVSDEEACKGKEFLIQHHPSFRVLWNLLSRLHLCTVIVEDHYVDWVYRDSYYFYYSSKHFNYSRFCKRLCIFSGALEKEFYDCTSEELGKRFIGSIVIRPIPGRSIGRTLLAPRYFLPERELCQIRLAKYKITVYGKQLTVEAFPYSMQDGETTSCAEITILNLLDYYSRSYPEYRYLLPSEISKLAELNSYERRMPTTGLSYELISKIFCEVGFYPRLYSAQKMTKTKFRHILYYYIESGIPVALGLKQGPEAKHSIIIVGHKATDENTLGKEITGVYDQETDDTIWTCDIADTVDTYCIMDDNREPYQLSSCIEEKQMKEQSGLLKLNHCEIEYMMVPLYKRMIMEAADAYDICLSILASKKLGIKDFLLMSCFFEGVMTAERTELKLGTKEMPIVMRLFMASSRTFRKKRDEQFRKENREVRDLYNITVFPKFVWICEITTKELHKKGLVIGEIVLDATSSAEVKTDSFIIIHYPNVICRRMPEDYSEAKNIQFEKINAWFPFERFDGNLENVVGQVRRINDND